MERHTTYNSSISFVFTRILSLRFIRLIRYSTMPWKTFHRYQMVSSIDLQDTTQIRSAKSSKPYYLRQWHIISMLMVSAITIIATITIIVRASRADLYLKDIEQPNLRNFPFNHCGTTPEEARKRGCLFEMHNFAWVPPLCYDEELSQDWNSYKGWEFSWAANDSSATSASFVQDCRNGNIEAAWVPWYQHMAHCSFILKKYLRSVMFDRPMDNWTSDWHHNEHCTNMMARLNVNPYFFNSLLHLKFPVCDYAWKANRPESMEVKPLYHD